MISSKPDRIQPNYTIFNSNDVQSILFPLLPTPYSLLPKTQD
ncbi:hypothetical protein [Moorena producens]|nr:hypothetical protein [Moorena producens]